MALDQSKKIVDFCGELLNVGSKLIHKKGAFVVFQLSDEAMALGGLDLPALQSELKSLSLQSGEELCSHLDKKLDLENKENQKKIVSLCRLGLKGVKLGSEVISFVDEVKNSLK